MAWRSFGSDRPAVTGRTEAGPGTDPHASPTAAHGVGWLGVWASAPQGEAVGVLWPLTPPPPPPPSLGGPGLPGVSGLLAVGGSIPCITA